MTSPPWWRSPPATDDGAGRGRPGRPGLRRQGGARCRRRSPRPMSTRFARWGSPTTRSVTSCSRRPPAASSRRWPTPSAPRPTTSSASSSTRGPRRLRRRPPDRRGLSVAERRRPLLPGRAREGPPRGVRVPRRRLRAGDPRPPRADPRARRAGGRGRVRQRAAHQAPHRRGPPCHRHRRVAGDARHRPRPTRPTPSSTASSRCPTTRCPRPTPSSRPATPSATSTPRSGSRRRWSRAHAPCAPVACSPSTWRTCRPGRADGAAAGGVGG